MSGHFDGTARDGHYDLIVIGSGSGLDVSSEAAEAGMQVAVIDNGPFGGTCLNRGCIPSKMLIHSADVAQVVRTAKAFGINASIDSIDWQVMMKRVYDSIDLDSEKVLEGNRRHQNIDVFQDSARFVGEHEIEVSGRRITGESILIAAGTRPFVPEIPGVESVRYLTSDEALRIRYQPKRLIVVGGGYIAAELAHFFGALGTDVTIVYRGSALLRHEDSDVSAAFTKAFARRFDMRLKTEVRSISHGDELGPAGQSVVLEFESGGTRQKLEADEVLFATGRVPNTDVLDAEVAGVELDDSGYVIVDEFMRTNVTGTWALGDVVGRYELKHNANLEAAHVAHNFLNPDSMAPVDYHAMPHAIFTWPQVASVGLTESEVRDAGIHYGVGISKYIDTAYGEAIDDQDGFVKVIVDHDSDEIVGCHIIGHEAAILVQEVVNVMRARRTTSDIGQSIYIHPALSEVVQRAFGQIDA